VAAYFHAVFESIHPFADGNGRVGREIMNYLLLLRNHPPIIVFETDRMGYYGAIETWDMERDLEPMKTFLKAEAIRTWAIGDLTRCGSEGPVV
jgi:Fic family protein